MTRINLLRNGKWCPACKHFLPYLSFSRNQTRGDGLSTRCRECEAARVREFKQLWGSGPQGGRGRRQRGSRGRPKKTWLPSFKRREAPFGKRRRVQGTVLEEEIRDAIAVTLCPLTYIAKYFDVSLSTVRRINDKYFPRKRRYQHGRFETRGAPPRKGYP